MSSPAGAASEVRSLYVHIPFCERKCEYCDFASVAGKRLEGAYVEALRDELRRLAAALPPLTLDTVFFGGGTPSFIDPRLLAGVLEEVVQRFTVSREAEITLEANPSSATRERASTWRRTGFNRVSIGVQSLNAETLRFLGRVHGARDARDAVAQVRRAGFDNISCDLIYAVPGLDDPAWRRTLDEVVSWNPVHVSCYELTVEPHTPLHAAVRRGRVRTVHAEAALRQHWMAVDVLGAAGYRQYEVSNFARPGHECRHNLVYWRCGYYVGAGVGAHGHLPAALAGPFGGGGGGVALRYWHTRRPAAYIEGVARGDLGIEGLEVVDAHTHQVERTMLGLRLDEGVPLDRHNAEVQALVAEGLLEAGADRTRVTRRGQEVLDQVILRACNPPTTRRPTPQTVG